MTSHLDWRQRHQLNKFLEEHYASSGLNGPAFADFASEKLGFPVNRDQVNHIRAQLGIPSNTPPGRPSPDKAALLDRLAEAEKRITALEHEQERLVNRLDHLERMRPLR